MIVHHEYENENEFYISLEHALQPLVSLASDLWSYTRGMKERNAMSIKVNARPKRNKVTNHMTAQYSIIM